MQRNRDHQSRQLPRLALDTLFSFHLPTTVPLHIVKPEPALRLVPVVYPLIRVRIRALPAIEFDRHWGMHRIVVCALLASIGEVPDLLVQAKGFLRRRCARGPFSGVGFLKR